MIELIGKRVHVRWRRPEDDWPTFIVLDVDGRFLRMRGVDDDEGHKHDGGTFWVNKDEIVSIQEAPLK